MTPSTAGIATTRRGRFAGLVTGLCLLTAAGAGLGPAQAADAAAGGAGMTRIAQSNATPVTPSADKSGSDARSGQAPAEAPKPSGSVDVSKLMSGEALPDVVIGQKDAPVTIVEYASMTCPHCAEFHEVAYPAIKKEFIDTGKAKLIIREFPFDPRALAAFMLARCAGDGDKRTAMVDVLFNQQNEWARADKPSEALLRIAKLAGMTEEQFKACLNDKDLQQKVMSVQQRAQNDFGVDATPTFFVNGDKYAGALSPEQMSAVIQSKL